VLISSPALQPTSSDLTAQVDTIRLIREPAVDAKRRVHESRDAILGDSLELLDILCVEGDELAVLVDARGGYGFGEDGGVACDCMVRLARFLAREQSEV
jgi:hypothetical protein